MTDLACVSGGMCRLCGPLPSRYDEAIDEDVFDPHDCPRAATAMSFALERQALAILNRTPLKGFWPIPANDGFLSGDLPYAVEGWTVVVFWDCGDWDYIDHVVTPDGETFHMYADGDERALPTRVAHWSPTNRLTWESTGYAEMT